MADWIPALVLIISGAFLSVVSFSVGAWVAFRASRYRSEGLFKDPKGDVFSIPDGGGGDFPGSEEPNQDEKHVLERANRFLKTIGAS